MPSAGRSRRWRSRGASCSTRSACAASRWSSTAPARCRARPICWQARATGRNSACSISMTAWSAERRILHEDWVDFCAAATLDTDYAAGFWTNRSDHPNAKGRVRLGMPRDAFFASGDLGQRIVIMPSQRLVVVRLGDSVDPTGDIRGRGPAGEGSNRARCSRESVSARSRTARPFPVRAHRPAGHECVRETPSPWDGPCSSPPRAEAASSGKLIWMSAPENSLPANHSLLPSSSSQ